MSVMLPDSLGKRRGSGNARAPTCRLGAALVAVALLAAASPRADRPVPPCGSPAPDPVPAYGAVGGPPEVAAWQDIELDGDPECLGAARGRMQVAVALAGRFRSPLTLREMAGRIGEISASEELVYWSTTDQRWRDMISRAYALRKPDPETKRRDFTAEEVLSGRTLHLVQNDTRSTSTNVFSLNARRPGPDRLVVEIVNVTAVRFLLFTLFEPRALRTVHILTRHEGGVWAYYGVSAVKGGAADGHAKSLINRSAAYYRYLAGIPLDREPPLAP